jgi:hypothetical protein
VHLQLEAPKEYAVNVTLLRCSSGSGSGGSGGGGGSGDAGGDGGSGVPERIDSVPLDREALTSGDYRPGFAYACTATAAARTAAARSSAAPSPPPALLPAGAYIAVVSTFTAGQLGGFVLTVASAAALGLGQPLLLPAEGAGMWTRRVAGEWSRGAGTAVGCTNYG